MIAHTPGPWSWDRSEYADWGWIRDTNGHLVACCTLPVDCEVLKHRRNNTDPTAANARLIAAAPELLEALLTLLTTSDNGYGVPTDHAWEMAEAAIAKATGKDQP